MKRVAPFALVVACACGTPDEIAPRILVDVCAVGGTESCAVVLTGAAVAADTDIVVTIRNPSSETLTLRNVSIAAGDPAFTLRDVPSSVAPGETTGVVVTVRPQVTSTINASLVIESDAVNAETVVVSLTVRSIDAGLPDIAPSRERCDFGEVRVGDIGRCDVLLRNAGVRDLILDAVALPEECAADCAFSVDTPVADGTALPPGTSASFTILLRATEVGEVVSVLTVFTNDPDESPLQIQLSGVVVD